MLWLLLNFVYAPSCGRFACSYEPAWIPQAQADSGSCPDSIEAATRGYQELAISRLAGVLHTVEHDVGIGDAVGR